MAVETNGPKITITVWFMVIVALIFISLRLYCKLKQGRKPWWDEYVLGAAWIFLLVDAILITASVAGGLGRHIHDIVPTNVVIVLKLSRVAGFFAILSTALSKTSFAITLLRLTTKVWHRGLLWFIIVSIAVVQGFTALFVFIQCIPVQRLWDHSVPGTCWASDVDTNFAMASAAYSGAMDFVLAFFPWVIIWKLQMKRKEKLGVAAAMSLGVLSGITAIVKVSQLQNLGSSDFTFYCASVLIWNATETSMTIVAASIPFLRILIIQVSSQYFKTEDQKSPAYRIEQTQRSTLVCNSNHGTKASSSDKTEGILQMNEITVVRQDRAHEEDEEGGMPCT